MWIIVAYPIVWVFYTLVRANLIIAPATGDAWWYPYPFLDPNGPGGVGSVVGLRDRDRGRHRRFGFLVVWVGRWRVERVKAEFATM